MTKNVIIFVLSPFGAREYTFLDQSRKFSFTANQTNETAVAYLAWKLGQIGEKVDKLFIFVSADTDKPKKDNSPGDFAVFSDLMSRSGEKIGLAYGIDIEKIPLSGGDLASMMRDIPLMYDKLDEYRRDCGAELRVHVDVTGGFRHASMMMLPLARILYYSGMDVGEILYANTVTGYIEDASELLAVFSLVGGAEEFISFGNVKQILSYFPFDEVPLRLENLLSKMQNFSDTALICGNYENMEMALTELAKAMELYEESIKTEKPTGREVLFAKLLPRIKQEYLPVLPTATTQPNPIALIEWCIERQLLPQAVIFYTEWLPHYLVESGKLQIKDTAIPSICQKNGKMWQQWETQLFLNYTPPSATAAIGTNVQSIAQSGNLAALKTAAKEQNAALYAFLTEVESFLTKVNRYNFADKVIRLPRHNLIYRVLARSVPENSYGSLKTYLGKRVEREGAPDRVIVKAFASLSRNCLCELFGGEGQGEELPTEEKGNNIQDKVKYRSNVFRELLSKKQIVSAISDEKLIEFIGKYVFCVNEWRNKIGHAAGTKIHSGTRRNLGETIRESLDLLK